MVQISTDLLVGQGICREKLDGTCVQSDLALHSKLHCHSILLIISYKEMQEIISESDNYQTDFKPCMSDRVFKAFCAVVLLNYGYWRIT